MAHFFFVADRVNGNCRDSKTMLKKENEVAVSRQNLWSIARRTILRIADFGIKQIQKFTYFGSVITEDGKFDTEVRSQIGIAKHSIKMLNKSLRDRKNIIRNKDKQSFQ